MLKEDYLQKICFEELDIYVFNAGCFWSDAGAAMGVLPKAIWEKSFRVDEKNRLEFATNLLLVRGKGYNLLIDTGIGYYPDEKLKKIYSPDRSQLLENLEICGCGRFEIDYVVLTHLHHDHIGGLIHLNNRGTELMFPLAQHLIQRKEWETARNPDELNRAAYGFNRPLEVLAQSRNLKLIEGNYDVSSQVKLIEVGGHSAGSQIVKIADEKRVLFYPGDIIPQATHLQLPVTSAYDISRNETFLAKKIIMNQSEDKETSIVFNHQKSPKLHQIN